MTAEEWAVLGVGDVITPLDRPEQTFIVTGNYGGRVTAVASVDITDKERWVIKYKANYHKGAVKKYEVQ